MIGLVQLLFVHHLVGGFTEHFIILNLSKRCLPITPGLKIVIPSTPYDAKGLLKAAIRDEDPVIFFEHKRAYRLIKGEVPEEDYTIANRKSRCKT